MSELLGGGSPARVWRVSRPTGDVVLKYLTNRDDVVDGHDLATFRRKIRQIKAIHDRLPRLARNYTAVLQEWHGPDWSAFAMPEAPGRPLVAYRSTSSGLRRHLTRTFDILGRFGYADSVTSAEPNYFDKDHVARVVRRWPVLRSTLPGNCLRDHIVVNGLNCWSALSVVRRLRMDPLGMSLMNHGVRAFPVHGDLNLGNILVTEDSFTVIDPRGTLAAWDPVYDLAKALFSLTIFEDAMTYGLDITESVDGSVPRYDVLLNAKTNRVESVRLLLVVFESMALAEVLDAKDPHWRYRLLLLHAMHCLAESACRISDVTERSIANVSGENARLMLSQGLYLLGIRLLNSFALAVKHDLPPWSPDMLDGVLVG